MKLAKKLLFIATGVCLSRFSRRNHFHLAAAGLRNDGVCVTSYNERAMTPTWQAHAEARLCRKMTPASTIAVVRLKADRTWGMARPCRNCLTCLKRIGVRKIFYSISPNHYGVIST